MRVGIIDCGIANAGSVANMLRRTGTPSQLVHTPQEVAAADAVILPGVGHFRSAMQRLHEMNLVDALRSAALEQHKPLLGICLGMQLLGRHSEEGDCKGLGIVDARCVRFALEAMHQSLPVPHMGWRTVTLKKASPLIEGLPASPRFYFVHSYHMDVADPGGVLMTADYGYTFVAGLEIGNVAGVQFHPEKSHAFGQRLLTNFVARLRGR